VSAHLAVGCRVAALSVICFNGPKDILFYYCHPYFPELTMSNKNKNIRDMYRGVDEFKKDYRPRNNLVKDENGDLLADSNNILNR
jgi:hypothetical protein